MMEQYEHNQAEVQEQQDIRTSRTKRRKQNQQKQKKEKKKLSLWVKCIGCILIPYLFILMMGVVNTYAMPVNVTFVFTGSVVLLVGMIVLTIVTTKRKKV